MLRLTTYLLSAVCHWLNKLLSVYLCFSCVQPVDVASDQRRYSVVQQPCLPAAVSDTPPFVSRLGARRQSTPVIWPLRPDSEFRTSPSSHPFRSQLHRQSMSTEDETPSGSAIASRYSICVVDVNSRFCVWKKTSATKQKRKQSRIWILKTNANNKISDMQSSWDR